MKNINEIRNVESYSRHIYGLCNMNTRYALQNEFFAKFWIRAFPEKLEHYLEQGYFEDSYCIEWIKRFMNGTPTIHMDRQSLKAYIVTAIEWNDIKLAVMETE